MPYTDYCDACDTMAVCCDYCLRCEECCECDDLPVKWGADELGEEEDDYDDEDGL